MQSHCTNHAGQPDADRPATAHQLVAAGLSRVVNSLAVEVQHRLEQGYCGLLDPKTFNNKQK
jgi:hypothetical protein